MAFSETKKEGAIDTTQERREIGVQLLERAQELAPELREKYVDFHENPELGGEEKRTSGRVFEELERLGIEIVGKEIGYKMGTGVVARIKGKEGGATIALRADMDALPIQEDPSHELRSKKDKVMHACGHDAHTTGLLGGAKLLKELADKGELPGDVILLFQPSEEKTHQKESGSVQMVKFLEEQGLRDEIKVFFGIHVRSDHERGWVNLKEGIQFGSSGEVDITLRSPGGHIMNAYTEPNLNLIFAEITVELDKIFRSAGEKKEALIASGRTNFAGSGYNVLPAAADTTFVVRIASEKYREIRKDVLETIQRVVADAVARHDPTKKVQIELTPRPGYRPVIHRDPELVAIANASASGTVGDYNRVQETENAGEDFCFYLEEFKGKQIPGAFVCVGAANPEKGIPKIGHHTPKFRIDQDVLSEVSALHATLAVNALKHFESLKT